MQSHVAVPWKKSTPFSVHREKGQTGRLLLVDMGLQFDFFSGVDLAVKLYYYARSSKTATTSLRLDGPWYNELSSPALAWGVSLRETLANGPSHTSLCVTTGDIRRANLDRYDRYGYLVLIIPSLFYSSLARPNG